MTGVTAVRIVKGSKVFHVHGEQAGAEGVWLAKGQVDGLYDSPVKSTWKTGAFQDGSKQKAHKKLHRDLNLGFHVTEKISSTYELNESAFMQIFDYEADPWDPAPEATTIEVETTLSGVRKIDVLMYEQPEFQSDLDPIMNQYGNLILKLRAGQPMWYQDNLVDSLSGPGGGFRGYVTVENPSDQICRHKWVVTRGIWTLPDFQWVGPKGERAPGGVNMWRGIKLPPITDVNGGAVVDLDRQQLMIRDAHDTNLLPFLGGVFFMYPIPPYTPPTEIPVWCDLAPNNGGMAQLVMPLRWSRPWGLEWIDEGS